MRALTRRQVWIVALTTLFVLGGGLFGAWAQNQNQTYTNGTALYFQDNTGSMANSMFVFGDSSNRLTLGTGNSMRLTITPTGSVGIGTMNPSGRFEIASGHQIMSNGSAIYFRDNTGSMTNSMFLFADASNRLNLGAGNDMRMTITSTGNVGVGTANPAARFHVAGDAQVDGNIAAKYQDVAEWVKSPTALKPGTVVVIDAHDHNRVLQADEAYDARVAGVVSDRPGILLGEAGGGKVKVAQSGRVKVKVDATFGAVAAGDLLVTSPNPGHAMRSTPIDVGGAAIHRPGTLLGKALEPLREGQGEILVLLTLQ
jgi:hypothetical protein